MPRVSGGGELHPNWDGYNNLFSGNTEEGVERKKVKAEAEKMCSKKTSFGNDVAIAHVN